MQLATEGRIGRHRLRDVIVGTGLAGEGSCLGMEDLIGRLERDREVFGRNLY